MDRRGRRGATARSAPQRLGRLRRDARSPRPAVRRFARQHARTEVRSSTVPACTRGRTGREDRAGPVDDPETPLLELPGGRRRARLRVHRAVAARGLHARSSCTRGRTGTRSRRSRARSTPPGSRVASLLPLYRWSGPDEDERQAAVRYWKRAIQITVDLGCEVMNSEFNGRPEQASRSEAQLWRSMEELLPVFEREGVQLRLEPHPDDFVEDGLRRRRHGARDRLPAGRASSTARRTPSTRAATSPAIMRYAGRAADPGARGGLLRPPGVAGCATSSTRQAPPPGSTSTWTSARARSTGTRSSAPSAARLRRPRRDDHDRLRLRLGGAGPGVEPVHARAAPGHTKRWARPACPPSQVPADGAGDPHGRAGRRRPLPDRRAHPSTSGPR